MPDPHRHTYDSRCGFMFIAGQPALLCRCHTWIVMLDGQMQAIPWEELPPSARWIVRRNQTRRHLLAFTIALALGLGALLIARGYRVRVVTFGAPRVAFFCNFALCRLARAAGELAEYRRAGDPVPAVPLRPFYKPVTRGIALGVPLPDPPGVIGEIAEKIGNHAIGLYADDLTEIGR